MVEMKTFVFAFSRKFVFVFAKLFKQKYTKITKLSRKFSVFEKQYTSWQIIDGNLTKKVGVNIIYLSITYLKKQIPVNVHDFFKSC
jgi:hypothetical protein